MNGALVVVRDFQGKPRLARIYSDRGAVVDVCSASSSGPKDVNDKPLPPIGVKRADVFRYSRELLETGNWSLGASLADEGEQE